MHRITVRRQQADEARSRSDFVVQAEDLKRLDRSLRDFLRTVQTERGTGPWSEADPEVWVGGTFVGRLERDRDIAELARQAVEEVGGSTRH